MKAAFYLAVLCMSLLGFHNSDTRTISGTVYDQHDRKPIEGISVGIKNTKQTVLTDRHGRYNINVSKNDKTLVFSALGFVSQEISIGETLTMDVYLSTDNVAIDEVAVTTRKKIQHDALASPTIVAEYEVALNGRVAGVAIQGQRTKLSHQYFPHREISTESYKGFTENKFFNPTEDPLSTFAIDVDAASYSNLRRFINQGQLPPVDAVRIEEMINYFQYDLKAPTNDDPVAIHTELSTAPWNTEHQLLRIGLKAKSIETDKLPPSNLVFLIDVSGSMHGANRLPLVKASIKMLVDQLRSNDHVAIVTYAGSAAVRLESTPGNQKTKIKEVIDQLEAGGSTAGGAGIKMAYNIVRQHFIPDGNNRIILASDGDFNVGASSDEDMQQLITKEKDSGISLSVFGFGMGNYKDSKMEILANKGHGNYAYIDNITEARKAMVTEFGGTLFTVAKDVKVQIEFNPAQVQAYRLIGYENRLLEKEDFNNDEKMGGDMGVGHTVTALYEIVPVGAKSTYAGSVDPLKYQKVTEKATVSNSTDVATVKFRYKATHGTKSLLKQATVSNKAIDQAKTSEDFRFASAVAELGMLLRNSDYKQKADFDQLITRAKTAKGTDIEGYRAAFIQLAESAKLLVNSSELSYKKQ